MSNFNLVILWKHHPVWLLLSALLISFSGCSSDNHQQQKLREQSATSLIKLPQANFLGKISLEEAIAKRRSIRQFASDSLPLAAISQLLWSAQGITESSKGYRTAPSAGALYPLELFLLARNIASLSPGIYLYHPISHSLQRIVADDRLSQASQAAFPQNFITSAPAAIAIIGIFSRTAKRYGAKAENFVYLEAGHAGQNIYLQATALGLGTVAVGAFNAGMLTASLELLDSETPLYIFPVGIIRNSQPSP